MPIRVNTNVDPNTNPNVNTNVGATPNTQVGGGTQINVSQRPDIQVNTGGSGSQVDEGGTGQQSAPSFWQQQSVGGSSQAASEAAKRARAERERQAALAREKARNTQLRKDNSQRIALDAFKGQRERRDATTQPVRPMTTQATVRTEPQSETKAEPSVEVTPRMQRADSRAGVRMTTNPVTGTERLYMDLDDEELPEGYAEDYYDFTEEPATIQPGTRAAPEYGDEPFNISMPPGNRVTALGGRGWRGTAEELSRLKDETQAAYDMAEQAMRSRDYAPEAGEAQRAALERSRDVREMLDSTRYRSPEEIREIFEGTYASTLAEDSDKTFQFADDAAFRFRTYDADVSDDEIRKDIGKVSWATNREMLSAAKAREQSPETSIDMQARGYIEYDPDSTVDDNVRNAERAAESSAALIANPLMIRYEGMTIERKSVDGDPRHVQARPRMLNEKGRDVDGAIGMVRRKYGCSYMNALRAILLRLGIGVDTHGKICGKSVDEFELPAVVLIEAANDLVQSQDQFGVPNAIVEGRPGGYSRSRDDTGMFPVLGGTRCYPFPYMPKSMFEDMSRDPMSPLHGMSEQDFYRACTLTHLNDTAPRLNANTNGPLAWQAAAFAMATRGIMAIDGASPDMLDLPEHQVSRTLTKMQADLMDAGDEAMREAFDEKMRVMPEVLGRWSAMNFKDGGARGNSASDLPGEFPGPGTDRRNGPVSRFFQDAIGIRAVASILRIGLMVTAPAENAISTAQQQVVVSGQNAYKRHLEQKWHMGDRFDKSDYLKSAMSGKDALESLEVYQTLMRIGGRTAVDAFRADRNDRNTGPRYHATKKDMNDFLQRWGVNQGSEVKQVIDRVTSAVMFGDGMFKRTNAQQFLDMALYEMAQNQLHGGAVLDAKQLEEIARSGETRAGAGEALVSALLDMDAGYEAFKTMGITSLGRTTPWGRATRAVLQKNGVIEATVRATIGMFPEYGVNKISRMLPGTNTISYILSHMVKTGVLKADEDMALANGFARGYDNVAQSVSRISDYQTGMDSADFWVGLRKNLAYDVVMFGGNYIVMGAIMRGVLAMLGGIRPPMPDDDDDESRKITLPEEWIINGLGVPIKAAWFMDDLLGCGLPLAYAWAISDGWDEHDKDGNVVGHVDAGSDKALGVASSAFINMVCGFNQGNFVVDAIDFVSNFKQNLDEAFRWQDRSVEEVREYYGSDAANMSEADMRREWIDARIEGILWDLFGDYMPPIVNEILPGSRDSIWSDGYTHSTRKAYDTDRYDRETAEREWRTKDLSYRDCQRCRKTQDNVLGAFFADLCDARDGIEYQYHNMPIETTRDPRDLAGESFERTFSLPLELDNGTKNLDLNGDGKTDTADEREEYLFGRAEEVCKYINDTYILAGGYPETAIADGFVIPFDARINAINYCHYMIGSKNRTGKLWADFYARKEREGFLPDSDYKAVQDEVQKYTDILYDYLNNEDIPWRTPRYAHLSTDYNTMYVDSEGNATNALDPDARAVRYAYGNETSEVLPFTSPRDTGLNDFNSPLWDVMLDEDGNPVNDMGRIYDQAARAGDVTMGRWTGNNVLDMLTNGGALERGDVLNLGERGWETFAGTYPEALKDPSADVIAKVLGIASYIPGEESVKDSDETSDTADSRSGSRGSRSSGSGYSRRSYYRGGYSRRSYSYGGSGYSQYNPKIYSTSRNVYSQRASGMSTHQPYKATSTYLRPGFYTKGSREAYRRSDI